MNRFIIPRLPARFIFLLLLLGCCRATPGWGQQQGSNGAADLHLADPAILYHQGTYYLYGTSGKDANAGFEVYTSRDRKTWEGPKGARGGYALRRGDAFGQASFWAPHVFYHHHKFYMAYAAEERIAIAVSDSPLGPFVQTDKKPLAAPVKQIDPFVFIDDDGKKYLYHVRLTQGNRLFVAQLHDDLSGIRPETLQECISAREPWENTTQAPWPVAEGPAILKHRNLYYFVYSANDFRNPDYAVGYAVSASPYGPWKKYAANPILSRKNLGWKGTGHGDFVQNKKGRLFYVLHTHQSDTRVSPRKTALIRARFVKDPDGGPDKLVMAEKSFYFPRLKNGAGEKQTTTATEN
jgi:xylan 1,4-beta-xylosidase